MDTTKLSSKGQVVLPKSVRDEHGWGEGTEFIVETTPQGVLLRPKKTFPATRIDGVDFEAGIRREIRAKQSRGQP